MSRTALYSPAHVVLQRMPGSFGAASSVAPDASGSLQYGGQGMLDHRMPWNKYNALGNGAMAAVVGWVNDGGIIVYDCTTLANQTANVVTSAVATSASLVLTAGTGTVAITAANAPTMFPFGTVPAAGSLAVGAIPLYLKLGIRDLTAFYDPTTAQTAVLLLTAQAGATATTCTIRGYDYYGQAVSENVTVNAGGTVASKKALKIITSATLNAADAAHTYSIGTTSLTVGLHLAVDYTGYVEINVNGAGFTAAAGTLTVADTTATATATTGDVRGTVVLTAVRNIIRVTPSAARLTQTPLQTGLFGVVNFTN